VYYLNVTDCTDEDTPLSYEYRYYDSAAKLLKDLTSPIKINAIQLKQKDEKSFYESEISIGEIVLLSTVYDSLGGITNITTYLNVTDAVD
jgi:proprotein convertase subtilisin/kexin type 5